MWHVFDLWQAVTVLHVLMTLILDPHSRIRHAALCVFQPQFVLGPSETEGANNGGGGVPGKACGVDWGYYCIPKKHSKTLNDEVCTLFQWLIPRSIRIRVIHRPGLNKELVDFLLRNRPDPTEWRLAERVVLQLFQLRSTPQVDLFTGPLNHHLLVWLCWTGHPLAAASDALPQPWTGLSL